MKLKHLTIVAVATVAIAGVGAVTAVAASATPPPYGYGSGSCNNSIYAGYVNTQTDGYGASIVVQNGQAVASKRGGDSCFFWFAYEGGSNKIAEYAPGGITSNEVLGVQQSRHHDNPLQVGLVPATAQAQWLFTLVSGSATGTWTYEGSGPGDGMVLAAAPDGQLYLASAPTGAVPQNEDWTYTPVS
jgi:hypothetical protein